MAASCRISARRDRVLRKKKCANASWNPEALTPHPSLFTRNEKMPLRQNAPQITSTSPPLFHIWRRIRRLCSPTGQSGSYPPEIKRAKWVDIYQFSKRHKSMVSLGSVSAWQNAKSRPHYHKHRVADKGRQKSKETGRGKRRGNNTRPACLTLTLYKVWRLTSALTERWIYSHKFISWGRLAVRDGSPSFFNFIFTKGIIFISGMLFLSRLAGAQHHIKRQKSKRWFLRDLVSHDCKWCRRLDTKCKNFNPQPASANSLEWCDSDYLELWRLVRYVSGIRRPLRAGLTFESARQIEWAASVKYSNSHNPPPLSWTSAEHG